MPGTSSNIAKIAYRNVSMVHGANPRQYFDDPTGPVTSGASALAETTRQFGAIPVADVSFEVRWGEIFVIMSLSDFGKSACSDAFRAW